MFKMKLRSQILTVVATILTFFLIVQISLYSILKRNSSKIINAVFDSVCQNTVSQLDNKNQSVAELSSLLSVHSLIQDSLYEYKHYEIVKNMTKIQELLNDYRARIPEVSSLTVVKNYKAFMSSESTELYDEINKYISDLKNIQDIKNIPLTYIKSGETTFFVYCFPVYPTNIRHYSTEHKGNFIVCVYQIINPNFSPYSFIDNEQTKLIISDQNNQIIFSSDADNSVSVLENKNNRNLLSDAYPIKNTSWNAIVSMPSKSASNLYIISYVFIVIVLILIVLLTILLLWFLNSTFIKRILLLKEEILKIYKHDKNYRITYEYEDEFSEIVDTVNQLLEQLNLLNQEMLNTANALHSAQMLQTKAYIYFLYNQVSPHFLYNSMGHIQGLAFKYNATEIVEITSEFAKVFRYCSGSQTYSTIKQDIDYAISYFNIINMRRENPIQLNTQIDKKLYGHRCLKMIFQPILENSLKYAFPPDKKGIVTISSIHDNDPEKIIFEITDTGSGMSSETLNLIQEQLSCSNMNEVQNSEHIGLNNVHMRLKLYYGEDCGLQIKSSIDLGTSVRIIFNKTELPNLPIE